MPGSIEFAIIVNYDKNVSDSNRKLTYSLYEYNYLQLPTIEASINTSEHNVCELPVTFAAEDIWEKLLEYLLFLTALANIPVSGIHHSQCVDVCNVQ